jgi:hypothetical protein
MWLAGITTNFMTGYLIPQEKVTMRINIRSTPLMVAGFEGVFMKVRRGRVSVRPSHLERGSELADDGVHQSNRWTLCNSRQTRGAGTALISKPGS